MLGIKWGDERGIKCSKAKILLRTIEKPQKLLQNIVKPKYALTNHYIVQNYRHIYIIVSYLPYRIMC